MTLTRDASEDRLEPTRLHPLVDRLGAYSWRLIGIGVVVVASVWLLSELRVVVFAVVVALFLSRVLVPVSGWLQRHHWPPGLAAGDVVADVLPRSCRAGGGDHVVGRRRVGSLRPTLTAAVDDVEDWLVEDAPFEVSRETVDRARARMGERVDKIFQRGRRSGDGRGGDRRRSGDGNRARRVPHILHVARRAPAITSWAIRRARADRRDATPPAADGGWAALGGYLRGAALLGVVEAVIIGITLVAVGGSLVPAVMVLTFVAGSIPIIGAIAAGSSPRWSHS